MFGIRTEIRISSVVRSGSLVAPLCSARKMRGTWFMMSSMADASLLVILPVCVTSAILSDWIAVTELGKLDVAHCNHATRKLYLEALCSIEGLEIIYNTIRSPAIRNKMIWMINRQVRCVSFRCWSNLSGDDPMLNEFFRSTGSGVRYMSLPCDEATTFAVLNAIVLGGHSSMGQAQLEAILATAVNEPACLLVRQHGGSWSPNLCFAHGRAFFQLLEIDTHVSSDDALTDICRAAPNLRVLKIDHPPRCSGTGFAAIGQCCHDLRTLVVWDAWNAELANIDKGLTAVATGCRKLEVFYMEQCWTMTDAGVFMIMSHCSRIKDVNILGNEHITSACLTALARCAGGYLESLVMRDCTALTGSGIVAIATHCPALHTLVLGLSEAIDTLSMQLAIPYLKRLTKLNIFHHVVTDVTLTLIAEHMPRLVDLDVGTFETPQYTIVGLTELVVRCVKLQRLQVGDDQSFRDNEALLQQMRPGLNMDHRYKWEIE